ncbi:MAG: bifunctional phosphopantothenoylcysteine decarboxylase/phosphopantothenate--cysteine ligase CoaBC [Bacteroidetes bacterium]|nr:bifunctional phosphopantothenoylcysteine decarboxylase/phosphopantothenate--cysteine ligase CoaBC [Bacteroidota bacterium]
MNIFQNKNILIAVTGGIAAYKMCSVVRLLKKENANIKVIMTEAATQFVTPLTFSTLSENEVTVSLWPENKFTSTDKSVEHISLGLWANVMLIAPASAHTISKIANGFADDLIGSTILSLRCPLVIAPAMDVDMFKNESTQKNISKLKELGYLIIPPETGELASGLKGVGRLPEPETLVNFLEKVLNKTCYDLKNKNILITAGPTFEPIDPVRFIGNYSSGKMGFALARAAKNRGAKVTLITGPVSLEAPKNIKRINVTTSQEMSKNVFNESKKNEIIIMSAAVADFTPTKTEKNKIKKNLKNNLTIKLKTTTDILGSLKKKNKKAIIVGFALETENEVKNATSKLYHKNIDMIVLNSLKDKGAGFGGDNNKVTIIDKFESIEELPLLSKYEVADEILNRVVKLLK